MPAALNLSHEVVKMRAEVKKVKVFVIRKLTRSIEVLKKKKGNEAVLEKNKRRVGRLHEEIRVLRTLAPDTITKTALQKDIDFNKVCQNDKASLSERAIARVATHPDFSTKILNLKKAVEAFEAERKNDAKTDKKSKKESKDIKQQSLSEPEAEDMDEAGQSKDKAKQDEDAPITATEKSIDTDSAPAEETDSAPAEVRKMRKEVKKLKMLLIRKLSQDISSLKKMKGEESDLKVHRDSAAKLQNEVRVLRGLVPDCVTTRALQENMEEVLQNPESSPVERATARIATHSRFIQKLQAVRESIEMEKMKAALTEEENMVREIEVAEYSDSDVEGEESESEEEDDEDEEDDDDEEDKEEEEEEEEEDGDEDDAKGDDEEEKQKEQSFNLIKMSNAVKPPEEPKSASVASAIKANKSTVNETVKTPLVTPSVPTKNEKSAILAPEVQPTQPEAKKAENKNDEEEESDLEQSDDEQEKEYFDDSTEERFNKQSSLSEESDEDDFFLGKVSKLKKKKSTSSGAEKKSEQKTTSEAQTSKESANKSREFKMQSVFCSALSESGGASEKGQPRGSKPPQFQNQKKHPDGDVKPSWFKSQGSRPDRRTSPAGAGGPGPRQMGKPEFKRQHNQTNRGAPGKAFRPPQHSQQAMHPSWEASRKRKEQQSQITAFQGKKIKFDDDD